FSLAGFAFVQLGWIRLMDIRASDIRGGLLGIAAAVLLALLATWAIGQGLMASRLFLVTVVSQDFLMAAEAWLFTFTRLSERFALFNLLPLLSLSAGHVTRGWLPIALLDRPLVLSGLTLILAVLVRIWFWYWLPHLIPSPRFFSKRAGVCARAVSSGSRSQLCSPARLQALALAWWKPRIGSAGSRSTSICQRFR